MEHYPVKILLAFSESFKPKTGQQFFDWLLNNGYPELAALSSCVRGSSEAKEWLIRNNFMHLAAFDSAIDGDVEARQLLLRTGHQVMAMTADAVNGDQHARAWLNNNHLDIFYMIALRICDYLRNHTFDIHKPISRD